MSDVTPASVAELERVLALVGAEQDAGRGAFIHIDYAPAGPCRWRIRMQTSTSFAAWASDSLELALTRVRENWEER